MRWLVDMTEEDEAFAFIYNHGVLLMAYINSITTDISINGALF